MKFRIENYEQVDIGRLRHVIDLHELTQREIGMEIGYKDEHAQSAVGNALGGRNMKALKKIIDYICTVYNYDVREFVSPVGSKREEMDQIRKDIRDLKDTVYQILQDMKTLIRKHEKD